MTTAAAEFEAVKEALEEAEVAQREAGRLGVNIEHHLRDIPAADRPAREETHLATVESLARRTCA